MKDHELDLLGRYDWKAKAYAVMVAYADGEISEGQAMKIIGTDRLDVRDSKEEMNQVGQLLWKRYREIKMTIDDDIEEEIFNAPCGGVDGI